MLNKRISNFMDYCERLKYYQAVAMLYEKMHDCGWIREEDFYCPFISNDNHLEQLLTKKADCCKVENKITKMMTAYHLNAEFCNKIGASSGLRYLLAIGFHDVPVVSFSVDKNNFKMMLSCRNAKYKPNVKKDTVEICFEKVLEKPTIKPFELEGFYYDRQEIYCLENGKLLFVIGLNNRGSDYKSVELEIMADDIIIS